jgi:signal transduction histidine kinase
MSWLTPLGFLGFIGLIILIIIYIIKPNYQNKIISSTFIWKLSLKFRKKRIPINKLNNILIFLCQLLILTICSALLAQPVLAQEKIGDENEKIIVNLFISSKYIVFTINNKGEYIKKNELPHVFERFYRTSKEREVGGHGLGLSIAKKKCEQIGAKISVESDMENGTTFTVMMKNK